MAVKMKKFQKNHFFSPVVCFLLSFLLSIFLVSPYLFPKNDSKNTHLNVLLITIDTLRPDRLSCYSAEHMKTPNVDSLARRGVLFSKAFAHTPTTLPSHANILLGMTPPYHGIHHNSNFIVREEFLTLSEHLKNYDYATSAYVGAFPLDSRFGLTQGFDIYDDHYGGAPSQEISYIERKAEVVVEKAINWLETEPRPWFLWIHCFDPHHIYDPPEPFKTQYKNQLYDGEVAYVDFALGKLFHFLEKNDLYQNTLIVFTGDHGESLDEHGEATHGYFGYNSTMWVPLIIYSPGIKPGVINQNVFHIDIFPTVCEALNIEKPSFLQGISLLPAMKKGKKLEKRSVYFESLYPYYTRGWAPLRGYIQENTKFIDSPLPEFYDLEKDFDERKNLAMNRDVEKYRAKLEKLIKEQSYSKETEEVRKIDRETREKLESLGYVSSINAPRKKSFTPKDDLKALLPYQNKLMEAIRSYHHGRIDEGIDFLKEIIQQRKDFDQAYSHLATFYKEQKKLAEAVKVLKDGIESNPSSYKLITSYGILLVDVGLNDEALAIFEKGLRIIDYDPELWNYMGVAYYRKGDYKKALKAYQKALSLDENYPIIINNLGSLYLSMFLKTKDPDAYGKAVHYFKKAIELDPDYASAYNGLGGAYRLKGDRDAAIYCWEKAVELNPNHRFALYNLGLAYLEKGDKNKALSNFEKYKDKYYHSLNPGEKNKLHALIQKCQ